MVVAVLAATITAVTYILWWASLGPDGVIAPLGLAAGVTAIPLSLAAMWATGYIRIPAAALLVAAVSLAAWLFDIQRLVESS